MKNAIIILEAAEPSQDGRTLSEADVQFLAQEETYLGLRDNLLGARALCRQFDEAAAQGRAYWQEQESQIGPQAVRLCAGGFLCYFDDPQAKENLAILAASAALFPAFGPALLVLGAYALGRAGVWLQEKALRSGLAAREKRWADELPSQKLISVQLLNGCADLYKSFCKTHKPFLRERTARLQTMRKEAALLQKLMQ